MKTKDCRCENGEMCWDYCRVRGHPAWCGLTEKQIIYENGDYHCICDNIRDMVECPRGKPISTREWFEEDRK